ncbi:MAG TPA: invasin domain 3-containing protein, partial [Actinophytocola sp.]|uniref:invasin domain 3-containing protein n=1 Tax=Actinophytocola sp. TaxID=1872138 RepID=UPI002DBB0D59
VTVQLKDASGNNLTTGGATVVITTDLGTVSGVTDNDNGTYTATLTSATSVGTATLGFTVAGTAGTATATVAFVPGPADPGTSTIAADPGSIVADGVTTSTVTVRLKDAQGNNLTTGGATVVISTDLGTLSATTDNGDGTYTATLTSGTAGGTATLGFSVNAVQGVDTATVAFVPGPSAITSTITADPSSITADGASTSTITVQSKDAEGNDLTIGGATVVISTDLGTVSGVTDNDNGTYTATLTSGTTAGTATLGFTIGGTQAVATVAVALTAGPADPGSSTISAAPGSIVADGVATSTVTVQLRDALGNPLTSSGGTVVISTDAGTISVTTDNGDGTYTASLTSVALGTATLSYTLGGTPGAATATVAFVVGPPDATTSEITASTTTITADGTSTTTITLRAKDSQGNDVGTGGAAVALATTAGTLSAVTDNGDGTYTATLTAPTTAGSATVSFTLNGTPGANSVVITLEPGVASPATSRITADPTGIAADGNATSTVTVRLIDAYGNQIPTGGPAVVIATDLGTIGATTDNGDGTYTATLTSATTAGTATLSFTIAAVAATATATVEFQPGAAVASTSEVTASPAFIAADGTSTSAITVQAKDAFGNDVTTGGAVVVIATDAGTISGVTDNGNGTYTATLTSATTLGTATLTFTMNGAAGTDTATVRFVPGLADPALSEITADPPAAEADGVTIATILVRLRDSRGFQLEGGGATVTITTTAGTLSAVTGNGDGTYRATLTAPRAPGIATIGFTVNGSTGHRTATVTFTDTVAPAPPVITSPAANAFVRPNTQLAGTGEPGVTVTVRDGTGNDVCATVVTEAGDWSCFPGSPLPAGEVDLVAVATDLGANVSPPSTAITVTVVDTTPAVVLSLTDAAPGDTQTALGTGFLPGETISGLLESTPVALGTQSAGGDGRVTFSITIPTDITVGTHRVTLTGQASGAVWATFDVVLVATPESPELAATGSGEGDLAFTGTNLGALLLLAIVAFALGARLVLAARVRRRRTGP